MTTVVTRSYHPFCVTAVRLKLRLVTNLTVSFQTEEADSNLTVNVMCNLTEYHPHFKTENLVCPPEGLELIS